MASSTAHEAVSSMAGIRTTAEKIGRGEDTGSLMAGEIGRATERVARAGHVWEGSGHENWFCLYYATYVTSMILDKAAERPGQTDGRGRARIAADLAGLRPAMERLVAAAESKDPGSCDPDQITEETYALRNAARDADLFRTDLEAEDGEVRKAFADLYARVTKDLDTPAEPARGHADVPNRHERFDGC